MNQHNDDPIITLSPMPLSAVNFIIMGLGELPAKVSRRLLDHIERQTKAQLEPPPPPPAADTLAANLKAEASKQTTPMGSTPAEAPPEVAPEPTPEPAA